MPPTRARTEPCSVLLVFLFRRAPRFFLAWLGRGSVVCVFVFLAAAQPFRGGPQASADRLFRPGFRRGSRFRLRSRIVLAADELDLRDLGAVAFAIADA